MLEFHPYANLFPLLDGSAFDELVASIKRNGLHDSIIVYDGSVLDGRNRQRACETAGVNCRYEPLPDGADPLAFVIDKNLRRRHLNDDQRRMVAARLANMGRGRPSENPAECGIKLPDAARLVNVDAAGAERARTVLSRANPEVCKAVDAGNLTVAAAVQAAKLDPDHQRKIADEVSSGSANVVRLVLKKAMRAARERELGQKQEALPNRRYGVIVADPEWHDDVWSEAGMDRHAANHYSTSAAEAITARPVGDIAAEDCVLWMWTTNQHLRIALDVMETWGFAYKSNYCWAKDRISLGRWQRGKHELLLIGTRGTPPCPAPGTQRESLISAPKSEHSAKPDAFLEMIEAYYPTLPKIELNRRGPPREGWSAWGNEVEQIEEDAQPENLRRAELVRDEAADSDDIPDFLMIGHPNCWRNRASEN